ncbi:MAG: VOC family protein [Terracidiphilus sp.]|nr:VOC family protein [Terracidiphilus sp.]
MSHSHSTAIAGHRYHDAHGAIEWLVRVFGFERHAVYEAPNGSIAHAQLTLGNGMIMLGSARDDAYGKRFKTPRELDGVETRSQYILVADADAAFARATAAGAEVVRALYDTAYDSREFTVRDPEGYTWTAGTYDPWASQA